ncbi:MAG: glycoside hydrolase family 5 [Microbacteriaceae bacterium]|nr:glycoside hydrolase family 5 [Microbacteriaceae bacterium]
MTDTTTLAAGQGFERRPARFDGYVHALDARLVDGGGRQLLLRGVGLGNWMLPEGYMWRFGPGAESPRQIEILVSRLLGEDAAESFWSEFQTSFIAEADIERISASGFDHVRLPINSRLIQDEDGAPIEAGYAMIDRLIEWCRTHRLWVLLDLHGAPGGQTGTNIDDSPRGMPELFADEGYRSKTLRLWRDLATRYAGETVVLGYDLLNEPLPNEWQHIYSNELVELYKDLTAEIRRVDPDHLIVYEGSHWATNWDIFTEVWDDNSLLQFHKYWSSPDVASISDFLEVRDRLHLPIYMGEGGENTLEWIYAAFRLYETYDIGWNFWPWKKIATTTSPASIEAPSGWDRIVASVVDPSAVTATEATRIFADLLVAMRIENCRWQGDVLAALFADNPLVIPAWGFGYRGAGESYSAAGGRPFSGIRDDDAVTLRWTRPGDNPENPFEQSDGRPYRLAEELVVELATDDWLEFELAVGFDTAVITALDATGNHAAVSVEPSSRGFRVVATAPTSLSRILPRG